MHSALCHQEQNYSLKYLQLMFHKVESLVTHPHRERETERWEGERDGREEERERERERIGIIMLLS